MMHNVVIKQIGVNNFNQTELIYNIILKCLWFFKEMLIYSIARYSEKKNTYFKSSISKRKNEILLLTIHYISGSNILLASQVSLIRYSVGNKMANLPNPLLISFVQTVFTKYLSFS